MNSTKKRIILESWFLVDFSLFEDDPKMLLTKESYKDYLTSKGAFLSNLFEMYGILGYTPDDQCYNSIKELFNYLEDRVDVASEKITELLNQDGMVESLKEELKETVMPKEIKEGEEAAYVVSSRYKKILLDEVLLRLCVENSQKDKLQNWRFKLLYNSHKSFRNALVESCFTAEKQKDK